MGMDIEEKLRMMIKTAAELGKVPMEIYLDDDDYRSLQEKIGKVSSGMVIDDKGITFNKKYYYKTIEKYLDIPVFTSNVTRLVFYPSL